MMHQPFIISAGAVAWYAAIVSTIVRLVQVLNYLRDRAKIKIIFYQNFGWRVAHPRIISGVAYPFGS